MATEYSVGVSRNRFELIDMSEDVDPFEILKIREKEKEAKKKKQEEQSDKENKRKEGSAKKEKGVSKDMQKPKEDVKPRSSGSGTERNERPVQGATSHTGQSNRRQETEHEETHADGIVESKYERIVSRGERRSGGGYQEGNEGRPGRGRIFGRGRGRGGDRNYEGRRGGFQERGDRSFGGGGGYQERSFGGGGAHQERSFGGGGQEKSFGGGGYQERSYGGGVHQDRFSGSGKFEKKEELDEARDSANTNDNDDWNMTEPTPAPTLSDEQVQEIKPESVEDPLDTTSNGTIAPTKEDSAEEELRELTLDEWKALKKRDEPTYNLRKAGEGEDLTKWKNMVALKKDSEKGTGEEDSEGEYELCEYPQRVGRQKYVKDINFKFAERRRGGGAPRRGGRGRDRRSFQEFESYDGQKFAKKTAPPPKVDDEHDFPSLG